MSARADLSAPPVSVALGTSALGLGLAEAEGAMLESGNAGAATM